MITKTKRYKPLYKKFIRLKVNPLKNNKIFKFRRKKWKAFLNLLEKTSKFYKKFKPYTHYDQNVSKFASQGNSYKRKFRNDLITRKKFTNFYGGLLKKYVKTKIKRIYRSKELRDPMLNCIEFFESRLDSVLYRSGFCYSIKNARQLIAHKHVRVNGRTEKTKSYVLKQGDLIQIDPESIILVRGNLNSQLNNSSSKIWPIPPTYLIINYKTLEIVFGDIENYNFSSSFPFRLDINSVITNYYRH